MLWNSQELQEGGFNKFLKIKGCQNVLLISNESRNKDQLNPITADKAMAKIILDQHSFETRFSYIANAVNDGGFEFIEAEDSVNAS